MKLCEIHLDRFQCVSWAPNGGTWAPDKLLGFRVVRDTLVRSQTPIKTYARCREFRSCHSATRVFLQYCPERSWLKRWKITIVPDDTKGLDRAELEAVLKHCRYWRLLLLEVAIDFPLSSYVDRPFIEAHAVFGKSRLQNNDRRPEQLRYGTRKSGKLVRCYPKEKLGVFRVEVELHSSVLRRMEIRNVYQLPQAASAIFPEHFELVKIDWLRLRRYLSKRFAQRGRAIFLNARGHASSIRGAMRYLSRRKICNVHRFLTPMRLNKKVTAALCRWERSFMENARWSKREN